MRFERFEWVSLDVTLKGKLYKPLNMSRCRGVIIFTHGLGYCSRQYKLNTEIFTEQNYAVITYDLRGHAGTEGVWTLERSVEDLCALVEKLHNDHGAEYPQNICAMGHSTGALISALASIKNPKITSLSLITIVTRLLDSFKYWFESGYNVPVKDFFKTKGVLPEVINGFMDSLRDLDRFINNEISEGELSVAHRYGMLKSENWGEFFSEIAFSPDILEHAKKLNVPMILFRGLEDEVMSPIKTDALYDLVKGQVEAKLVITNSKDHFQNDNWNLIQAETLGFIDSLYKRNFENSEKC